MFNETYCLFYFNSLYNRILDNVNYRISLTRYSYNFLNITYFHCRDIFELRYLISTSYKLEQRPGK